MVETCAAEIIADVPEVAAPTSEVPSKPVNLLFIQAMLKPVSRIAPIETIERQAILRLHSQTGEVSTHYVTTLLLRLAGSPESTTPAYATQTAALHHDRAELAKLRTNGPRREKLQESIQEGERQTVPYAQMLATVKDYQADYRSRFFDNQEHFNRVTFLADVYGPTESMNHPGLDYLARSRQFFKPDVFIHADRVFRLMLLDTTPQIP